MRKIGILSATLPQDGNTGMLTVDYAGFQTLNKIPNAEVNWYTFPGFQAREKNIFHNEHKDKINFHILPDSMEGFYDNDVIILWGDFLVSNTWIKKSGQIQLSELGLSVDQIKDLLLKCVLFESAPTRILNKVIIFGATVISDGFQELFDERYKQAFIRLIENAHKIWMRDAISANRLLYLAKYARVKIGVDPAFLMAEIPGNSKIVNHENVTLPKVGIFFGSRSIIDRNLINFLERIEIATNCKLEWISWFKSDHKDYDRATKLLKRLLVKSFYWRTDRKNKLMFYRLLASKSLVNKIQKRYPPIDGLSFSELLLSLQKYSFILTDTYHLCVNSWREKTPALCFVNLTGRSKKHAMGTLIDDKKFALYSSFYGNELMFSYDDLICEDTIHRKIKLAQSGECKKINLLISEFAQHSLRDFLFSVESVLNEKAKI